MKKTLLFGLTLGMAATAVADVKEPVILPEFYSSAISPDGKYIVSQIYEDITLYNTQTGEEEVLEPFSPGDGNCFTADGSIIVGSSDMDTPVILKNGEKLDTPTLDSYIFCNLYGITSDGTRIVGSVDNPDGVGDIDSGTTMYVPMYVDLAADGTVGEVKYLPYPKTDWCGLAPQYIWCIYVSEDGKTIIGQVKDAQGMIVYPIVFNEGADGEWSYSLPTIDLINPNKIEMPEYPGEFTEWPPQMEDFMTDEEKAAYQAAFQAWIESGYTTEYPSQENYMSEEEKIEYNKAADAYNVIANEYNEKLFAYQSALWKILDESTIFVQNSIAMDAQGKLAAMVAEKVVIVNPDDDYPVEETQYPLYLLDMSTGDLKEIKSGLNGAWPHPQQILTDGTIIATTPLPGPWGGNPPTSYVVGPGAQEITPIEDYLAAINPEGAAWLKEKFTKPVLTGYDYETWEPIIENKVMTGRVVVSDDWSVVSGGVLAYMYYYEEEPEDEELNSFESYVIYSDTSGVETIESDARLTAKKYFDLNGFEVKDPSNGIFIERSVYSDGTVKTAKKAVK